MRLIKRLRKNKEIDPFDWIFQNNLWGSEESVSGTGSDLFQTRNIRKYLPELFDRRNIGSIVDAPCGDLYWISQVNLGVEYIGVDSVPGLIETNRANFDSVERQFFCLDLRSQIPPAADLIFARDFLVHLAYEDIFKVLENFKKSGATWLLTTTFPKGRRNRNIKTGRWRPLDLTKEPFGFPPPTEIFEEGCTEAKGKFSDKSLGLWNLGEIKLKEK